MSDPKETWKRVQLNLQEWGYAGFTPARADIVSGEIVPVTSADLKGVLTSSDFIDRAVAALPTKDEPNEKEFKALRGYISPEIIYTPISVGTPFSVDDEYRLEPDRYVLFALHSEPANNFLIPSMLDLTANLGLRRDYYEGSDVVVGPIGVIVKKVSRQINFLLYQTIQNKFEIDLTKLQELESGLFNLFEKGDERLPNNRILQAHLRRYDAFLQEGGFHTLRVSLDDLKKGNITEQQLISFAQAVTPRRAVDT